MTTSPLTPSRINRFRRFARTFVRRVGIVGASLQDANVPLLEGHILYELGTTGEIPVGTLAVALNVPEPHLARYLVDLGDKRLVTWTDRDHAVPGAIPDGRAILTITRQGRARVSELERLARMRVSGVLKNLTGEDHRQLVAAMTTLERLLVKFDASGISRDDIERLRPNIDRLIIRPHLVGDLGFVVHRHAILYAEAYGWDERFEALVAKVAAEFIENFRPETDRAFIAEVDGHIVGSAFVVADKTGRADGLVRLRMVYVEPEWRGVGLGRRLVEEAMSFARVSRAQRMTLWTNDVLTDARRLYEALGFRQTAREPYEGFGKTLVGETWERDL